uniref:hypothetical protein n=1 Tax=Prevotella sp. TaxID=59823 RepID=UPI0040252DA1
MLKQKPRTFKGSFTCRWAPSDGEDGKDGVGIKSADVVFCLSTSGTTPPADNAGWVTLFKDLQLKENTYVWSCTKTVLTNGTTSYSGKQCLGASKDFVSILELYALSSSGTTAPTSGWETTYKTEQGKWLWTKNRMQWTNGSFTYTTPVCIGHFAKDGENGKDGQYTVYDFALSVYGTASGCPTDIKDSDWKTIPPVPTTAKPYVWMRIRNYDGSSSQPYNTGYTRVTGESGMDGAYTDYSYNISKNKTSKNSSTAPTDCYYSTWQDAPMATTETYPFLWMRMERKNDASDKSVRYVCVTGDKGDKGDKGDPGNPGTDGNGIASQESLFVATDKKAVASYGSVSGWSNRFPQPTEQKPYVWKCVKTTYTKASASYSTPELVTIYQSGANGNILRNASFTDESNMEAWVTQSQYNMASGSAPIGDGGGIDTKDKLHGHNSYFDRCSGVSGAANYKDVLVQTVQHSNGGLNNIVNGLWYTLSFWAKRAVNVITLNKAVSATSYATANVYLKAGVRYAIRVQSTVSSASYPITTTVTPNGTSVAILTIKQTASGSKTDYLTPSTSGIHAIRSVVSSGTGTVISYAVDDSRDLSTYLAPSLVDTSSKIYADGEERTPSADLGVVWSLASGWSFHTLTFKAAASLTASVKQQLFFRLDSVPHADLWRKVWICEPKLESGMMYTGYVDSAEDLKGIPGLIERTSEWVAGVEYHNDSNLTGGIRYRDIVTVTDAKGNFEIYVCQKTHLSTTSNAPKTGADSAEWLHVNGMRPIYTPLIIADNAVLRFGQTNRMLIMNSKQKVQGCFGGVEDEANGYPLWIGGETAEKANFKVGYDGTLYANRGEFSGVVRQRQTDVTPDNILEYFDRIAIGSGLSQRTYFDFKWDSMTLNLSFSGDFKTLIDGKLSALALSLPTLVPGEIYNSSTGETTNTGAMEMIGTQLMIVNRSSNKITLSNRWGRHSFVRKKVAATNPDDFDTYDTYSQVELPKGYMARLVCLLCNTSTGMIVGWECQKVNLLGS